ncbi:phage tail protein [Asticcacaulis endophyticus]|uniref:Oxidoreductase n=1 Tax=Asticcacaulis endophyticus TaxID=1395890 RepID=A0A918Q4R0_9CAUL|nr:phage tail protein [Asticcacaulis endophyticus]GGZ31965.1 oxidoreductase [Asticcacaulis endophyticus]
MMMTLGMFIFELASMPYQELQRRTSWRHAQTERFGARPALQYVGPGEETITVSGVLYGGVIGSYGAIEQIREMADAGDAYTMVSGTGEVLGEWAILSLDEKRSNFFVDGMHRKSDFTIELKRAEDAATQTATETTTAGVA